MVKDEKYFDRFDRAFGLHFKDLEALDDIIEALIPDDWLRSEFMKNLSEEEKEKMRETRGRRKRTAMTAVVADTSRRIGNSGAAEDKES